VLVLHSWWGLTPYFRGVADRLADAGFVALAPDLHAGRVADKPDEAEALLLSIDPTPVAELVRASAITLRLLPQTPEGPIGVVGFSMGASWAYWLAARQPRHVDAAVAFYGSQDIDFVDAEAAFQGHFAEHDEFVTENQVLEMEAHLRLLGKEVDFHHYPGTGHWFFEEDREVAYVPSAAEQAWDRTLGFLRAHLAA
jgi:carboxymethylenebutenolidase